MTTSRRPRILIVDDNKALVELLKAQLKPLNCDLEVAHDGEAALELISQNKPDLVLLDLMMPKISGFEICRRIKTGKETRFLPIIVITALSEQGDKLKAIELGADDFLVKPINRLELTTRIKSLLRMKFLHDDLDTSESILFSLAKALEAKDSHTRGHSERVAGIAVAIGWKMALPDGNLDALKKGGLLHDIGKIGIKESVLLKPGRLSNEEMEHVKSHANLGHDICSPLKSLEACMAIVRSHHERFDGKGYPDGLCGADIPLLARITAVADAFDAMTTDRPYRRQMTRHEALSIFICEKASGQWDPECVEALLEVVE